MSKNEILNIAQKYNIKIVKAPENKILYARDRLAKQGIYCEHTTAATYAAYLVYIHRKAWSAYRQFNTYVWSRFKI